jgi:hypothetical protein
MGMPKQKSHLAVAVLFWRAKGDETGHWCEVI